MRVLVCLSVRLSCVSVSPSLSLRGSFWVAVQALRLSVCLFLCPKHILSVANCLPVCLAVCACFTCPLDQVKPHASTWAGKRFLHYRKLDQPNATPTPNSLKGCQNGMDIEQEYR